MHSKNLNADLCGGVAVASLILSIKQVLKKTVDKMLFRFALIAAVLARACNATPYDISYTKLIVNPATKQSRFNGVATFSNGDAAVGGRTDGRIGSSSYGRFDFLVQRYSAAGALVWIRQIGGNDVDIVA